MSIRLNVNKLKKFSLRQEPYEITLVLDSVPIKGEVRKLRVENASIMSRYANVQINAKYYGRVQFGGIEYSEDYSDKYSERTLVDKGRQW